MPNSWDRDLSLELISEFQNSDILWDPKNKFHYNNVKKEDAWMEIGRKLRKDVDEIKKKMESLRGSYRKEKNRVKTKRKPGKGRTEMYVSKWFAYEHMKFLDNRGEPTALLINIKEDPDAADNELESSSSIDTLTIQQTTSKQPENNHTDEVAKNKRKPKNVAKRCARNSEDRRVNEAYRIIKNAGFVPKDECSAYGEFIATKLRKFDDRSRAQIQHQFGDIIYEAEMEMFHPDGLQQDPLSNFQLAREAPTAANGRRSSSSSLGSSRSPRDDFVGNEKLRMRRCRRSSSESGDF